MLCFVKSQTFSRIIIKNINIFCLLSAVSHMEPVRQSTCKHTALPASWLQKSQGNTLSLQTNKEKKHHKTFLLGPTNLKICYKIHGLTHSKENNFTLMRFNIWRKVRRVINNGNDPQLGGTPASLLSLITPAPPPTVTSQRGCPKPHSVLYA